MAIDSKFPLDAYLRLTEEGEEARKAFVTAVKAHADSIARKYIVPDENTLDFALMFVPSETVYYELLMSADSKGVAVDAYCRSRNIIAVSPNTLYAHLCVIGMGLRGMQIEENAKRLSDNLSGMRKQLDTFSEYFEKIGTHLKNAQQSYTEADKRFDKASNTLDNILSSSESPQPLLDDAQGTLRPAANSRKEIRVISDVSFLKIRGALSGATNRMEITKLPRFFPPAQTSPRSPRRPSTALVPSFRPAAPPHLPQDSALPG